MKKRRLLAALLAALLLLPLLTFPASADEQVGEGNIDGGGGGGMGEGSKQNFWNNEDGVRITILKNGQKVYQMDWSNKPEYTTVKAYFIPKNKLDYLFSNAELVFGREEYKSTVVSYKIPPIIVSNGSRIEEIRRYFTSETVARSISDGVGIPYDDLTGGEYKLLLEPIAYFTFQGTKWAMTATEAALYDAQINGQLRSWMKSLTHQNLPLSMFLERSDTELMLDAWTGSRSGKQSNADIVRYLGMGIVSFSPQLPPVQGQYDYEFRTDTDVIISFPIKTKDSLDPEDRARLYIEIGEGAEQEKYEMLFTCPGEQLLWFKWHTPKEPKELNARVYSNYFADIPLKIKVSDLQEKTPPDPTYYDRGDGFQAVAPPDRGPDCLKTTWGQWRVRRIRTPAGPSYEFYYVNFWATLDVRKFELKPDDNCPTDYVLPNGQITMKSGYGVQVNVVPVILTGDDSNRTGVRESDFTGIQNGTAFFPEFGYQTYLRLLEQVKLGSQDTLQFKVNPCSYRGSRIHYTPLWYPDGDYTVSVSIFDAWTPGGQLYATRTASINIFDACLNDWYIQRG